MIATGQSTSLRRDANRNRGCRDLQAPGHSATSWIEYLRATDGLGTTSGTTTTSAMIQTSIDNLRIRKSYTTSSAYVGVVPDLRNDFNVYPHLPERLHHLVLHPV